MCHARVALVALVAAGCWGSARPIPEEAHAKPANEMSPALEPLHWLIGSWAADNKVSLRFIAAGGALFGAGFTGDGGFEIMIIDDGEGPGKPDGKLRLVSASSHLEAFELARRTIGTEAITFGNDTTTGPQVIPQGIPDSVAFERTGTELKLTIATPDAPEPIVFHEDVVHPAPDLEAADRAFSADTAKRGIDGWLDAFAEDGGMLRKGKKIAGHAAIAETMKPLLESGKLTWAPIASGLGGEDELANVGYTVGRATFTGTKPDDHWRSAYITIWENHGTGWKVIFDMGRIVNE